MRVATEAAPRTQLAWLTIVPFMLLALAACLRLSGDIAGGLLLASAFLPIFASRELDADGKLAFAFLAVVFVHAAVAVVNSSFSTTLGADVDAVYFHDDATAFVQGLDQSWHVEIGNPTFTQLLALAYTVFSPSLLLGSAMSVVAFATSCVVFANILAAMETPRRAGTLLLFGLLPSGIMFLSVPLRESYEQLFLLIAIYAALQLRRRGARWIVPLVGAAGGLALWHMGLPIFSAFFIISAVAWAAKRDARLGSVQRVVGLVFGAVVVLAAWRLSGSAGALDAVANGQAFEFADNYRHFGTVVEARATYGMILDTSTPFSIAQTLPVVFFEYMFAPFPWQVGNLLDVDALFEGLLRLALIISAAVAWRRAREPLRGQVALLLWLYFGLQLLWAMGTVNWGTAIRHHLLGTGLLVAAGGPLLVETAARLVRRRTG
jgi:hypothetical protein